MQCPSCGSENPNASNFCTSCGAMLEQDAAPQSNAPVTIVNNTTTAQGNGIGTAGFVCALVAVFTCWIPILGWVVWLVGAILSIVGIFREPKGLAIAGTVISFIDVIVLLLVVGGIAGCAGIGAMSGLL